MPGEIVWLNNTTRWTEVGEAVLRREQERVPPITGALSAPPSPVRLPRYVAADDQPFVAWNLTAEATASS